MVKNNKKICIITATYNSEKSLENLANSIRDCKTSDIEWIVIDNLSLDNTLKIINKNIDIIDHFITEKDCGIYDAWNKGLRLTNADFITFIASDDLIQKSYLDIAINAINQFSNYNIISFKILYISPLKNIILNSNSYKKPINYPFNLGFFHPGTLHSKSLFENDEFDSSFKIAGDREFLTRQAFKLKPIIILTDNPQIIHYYGGVSTSYNNKILQHQEVLKILKKNFKFSILIFPYLFMTYFKISFFRLKKFISIE
jgi:glycosyltransferase involved in cell wall biosynthesis